MTTPAFIEIDVESQGISMRWKQAGDSRTIESIAYESEDGVDGTWRAYAIDDEGTRSAAQCALVEDSSDGEVLLVYGGPAGLELEHDSGAIERQPYLLLARSTVIA